MIIKENQINFPCEASVSILRKPKDEPDGFDVVRGTDADPYFIARLLMKQFDTDSAVDKIFKYGDFNVVPMYHSPMGSLDVHPNSPVAANRGFSRDQLFDFI